MIVTKIILIRLDIYDCINLYTNPNNLKQIIVQNYSNRCIKGFYLLSVDKIISASECIINQDSDPNFGAISVIVKITAKIYSRGEIINGCKVINRDKHHILICATNDTSIMLVSTPELASIKDGQIIPVRAISAKYGIGLDRIAVSAVPFLPNKISVIFKVSDAGSDDKKLLSEMLEIGRASCRERV